MKPSAPLLVLMAAGSAAAGAIHLAVIPAHADWVLAAAFFAALATFQLGWAASLLRRPTTDALRFGVAINAGALLLWVLSRTSGMPVGPHPGIPESLGRSDVLTAGLQTAVIAAALWTLVRPAPRLRLHRTRTRAPGFLGATGIAAMVSVLAVVGIGGASDHRHGPTAHPTTLDSPSKAAAEHAPGMAH